MVVVKGLLFGKTGLLFRFFKEKGRLRWETPAQINILVFRQFIDKFRLVVHVQLGINTC